MLVGNVDLHSLVIMVVLKKVVLSLLSFKLYSMNRTGDGTDTVYVWLEFHHVDWKLFFAKGTNPCFSTGKKKFFLYTCICV